MSPRSDSQVYYNICQIIVIIYWLLMTRIFFPLSHRFSSSFPNKMIHSNRVHEKSFKLCFVSLSCLSLAICFNGNLNFFLKLLKKFYCLPLELDLVETDPDIVNRREDFLLVFQWLMASVLSALLLADLCYQKLLLNCAQVQ